MTHSKGLEVHTLYALESACAVGNVIIITSTIGCNIYCQVQ